MQDSNDALLEDSEESEINLTPMLDVVFIMLIFFIVTAVFVREPGVEVERPEATTAITPEAATIFIAITPSNEIWIDGETVDPAAVRAEIERLHAENPESGVVVQADNEASNQALIQVMDAAKQAGVNDVTIAAGEE
ncbi:MAG: biopolymer transporter ExbD [Gammaproteobacteria bacterium]|nr:biopolymer transporter ExbD [Gammaproteobacteria bacterium]